jgi:hypothetical protein
VERLEQEMFSGRVVELMVLGTSDVGFPHVYDRFGLSVWFSHEYQVVRQLGQNAFRLG